MNQHLKSFKAQVSSSSGKSSFHHLSHFNCRSGEFLPELYHEAVCAFFVSLQVLVVYNRQSFQCTLIKDFLRRQLVRSYLSSHLSHDLFVKVLATYRKVRSTRLNFIISLLDLYLM